MIEAQLGQICRTKAGRICVWTAEQSRPTALKRCQRYRQPKKGSLDLEGFVAWFFFPTDPFWECSAGNVAEKGSSPVLARLYWGRKVCDFGGKSSEQMDDFWYQKIFQPLFFDMWQSKPAVRILPTGLEPSNNCESTTPVTTTRPTATQVADAPRWRPRPTPSRPATS